MNTTEASDETRRRRRKEDEEDDNLNNANAATPTISSRPPRKHRPSNGHLPSPLRRTKSYDSAEGNPDQDSLVSAITTTLLAPTWLPLAGILTLIFGGCCTNVFALEAIVKAAPDSGTVITAFQVLTTALFTLPRHLDFSRGFKHLYLKQRTVPLYQWAIFALMFVTINVLNNKAFGYRISVPLHIILRSAGPVSTMVVGYLVGGRRYRPMQILAVLLLFLGVVMAALSDARAKEKPIEFFQHIDQLEHHSPNITTTTTTTGSTSSTTATNESLISPSPTEFWTGFAILFLALLLSAFLGLFTDRLYAKHGRGHADENLFYSHALALPYFLFRLKRLTTQFAMLARVEGSVASFLLSTAHHHDVTATATNHPTMNMATLPIHHRILSHVPLQLVFLVVNSLTQYACIRGVNALSARTSSLTVGIVLNIRKLISLLASIWLFGNTLNDGVLLGALVVFTGGALYAWPAAAVAAPEPAKVEERGGEKALLKGKEGKKDL